jgi:uncharacterized membrane protein
MHLGPLPPPAQLAEYEAIYPGAARAIFELAEQNAAHTREMELRAIKLQRLDVLLARLLPFALVLAFLSVSVVMGIFANPWVGGAGLFGAMAYVLVAYLTGRMPTRSSDPSQ